LAGHAAQVRLGHVFHAIDVDGSGHAYSMREAAAGRKEPLGTDKKAVRQKAVRQKAVRQKAVRQKAVRQ